MCIIDKLYSLVGLYSCCIFGIAIALVSNAEEIVIEPTVSAPLVIETPHVTIQVDVMSEAKNVDLGAPIIEQQLKGESQSVLQEELKTIIETKKKQVEKNILPVSSNNQSMISSIINLEIAPDSPPPFILLETEIPPATATRIAWSPDQSFKGLAVPTPVLVVNGFEPGPVVCLTAAIHGDELNGIEIVRRVLYELDPEDLSGTVIGVPIVNLQGFNRSSRYLSDRRDLNRFFPGNPSGSSAARLAYSFFNEVILHCDVLVDLHTGSFHRTNMPQLRANTKNPKVLELAKSFGATVIVHGEGGVGTLRRSAVEAGIPAVTLEAGESLSLQMDAIAHGVKGIETLLGEKSMLSGGIGFWDTVESVYNFSTWVRADQGGILFSRVNLGDHIKAGDILGVVIDPITNINNDIIAQFDGRVIGMAVNQVVIPGSAAFHLGIELAEKSITPELSLDEKASTSAEITSKSPNSSADINPEMMDGAFSDDEDLN